MVFSFSSVSFPWPHSHQKYPWSLLVNLEWCLMNQWSSKLVFLRNSLKTFDLLIQWPLLIFLDQLMLVEWREIQIYFEGIISNSRKKVLKYHVSMNIRVNIIYLKKYIYFYYQVQVIFLGQKTGIQIPYPQKMIPQI